MEWYQNIPKNQLYLDKATESDPIFPPGSADIVMENCRVRGDVQMDKGAICSPNCDLIPHKTHNLGVFAEFTVWRKKKEVNIHLFLQERI